MKSCEIIIIPIFQVKKSSRHLAKFPHLVYDSHDFNAANLAVCRIYAFNYCNIIWPQFLKSMRSSKLQPKLYLISCVAMTS